MSREASSSCVLCGSSEQQVLFVAEDLRFRIPGEFDIVQCASCGLVFVNPQPGPDELQKHYPAGYYTHLRPRKTVKDRLETLLLEFLFRAAQGGPENGRKAILKKSFSGIVRRSGYLTHKVEVNAFDHLRTKGGRLLEIGFGNGTFLDFAAKKGYSTFGVEPDAVNCENARGRGHELFCGQLEEAHYDDSMFDFIRARHVLEHVRDPLLMVKEVFRIQKPGGFLFLEVPNFASLYSEIFRERWAQLEAPRHLFQFTPSTLNRVAESAGYKSVRMSFDTHPWQLLSSLQNMMEAYTKLTPVSDNADIRVDKKVSSSLHTLSRWLVTHGYGDNIICVFQKPS